MRRKKQQKERRVYQQKMWGAARFYCAEAQKSYKAKAYFCALVARACELEALLRIFDFVDTRKPKDRCQLREARNGVHAHLFRKDLFTRRTVSNVTYLVHSMYEALEIKNARNLMKALYERGDITPSEYWAWKNEDQVVRPGIWLPHPDRSDTPDAIRPLHSRPPRGTYNAMKRCNYNAEGAGRQWGRLPN